MLAGNRDMLAHLSSQRLADWSVASKKLINHSKRAHVNQTGGGRG